MQSRYLISLATFALLFILVRVVLNMLALDTFEDPVAFYKADGGICGGYCKGYYERVIPPPSSNDLYWKMDEYDENACEIEPSSFDCIDGVCKAVPDGTGEFATSQQCLQQCGTNSKLASDRSATSRTTGSRDDDAPPSGPTMDPTRSGGPTDSGPTGGNVPTTQGSDIVSLGNVNVTDSVNVKNGDSIALWVSGQQGYGGGGVYVQGNILMVGGNYTDFIVELVNPSEVYVKIRTRFYLRVGNQYVYAEQVGDIFQFKLGASKTPFQLLEKHGNVSSNSNGIVRGRNYLRFCMSTPQAPLHRNSDGRLVYNKSQSSHVYAYMA